jgi:RNA polymerase sigma factor (sigma-70 family)
VDPRPFPPFQSLLDEHGRDVHRFLVAMLGPVDADDAYQETWLAALRAYPRLQSAANLRSWVLTVAHRKAIDHVRARGRRAVPVGEPAEFERAGDGGAPSDDRALVDDNLWSRVRALPTKQRTAVALRFVVDAGYDQVATAMGTSEDAARRNVHEGLARLRKEINR